MGPELAVIPGVERVEMFRNGRIMFRGTPITLLTLEMASVAETAPRTPVEGNADDMYRQAAAGQGVITSENLAQPQQLRLGEQLEIPTPYGVVNLPIVGTIVDYSDQQGAVLVDRSLFLKYWRDDAVRDFRVFVASNASAGEVRQRILERYAGQRQVFVLTNDDLRTYILGLTDQWFGLTWIQIVVAVLVAILGVVNALTVSVIDRRRELGVLRAVGAMHDQVRRTILTEDLEAVGRWYQLSWDSIE